MKGNCHGPKHCLCTMFRVSLSPSFQMGGATFRSTWRTLSRSWAVQGVLQILSHFCWWAVRVCDELPLQPPLIHSVMSPTHVPDVVRASILMDYSTQWINRTGKNRLRGKEEWCKKKKKLWDNSMNFDSKAGFVVLLLTPASSFQFSSQHEYTLP